MSFAGLRVGLVGPCPPPAGGMANQTRQLAELLRAAQATVWMVQSNAPCWPQWIGRIPVLRAVFRLLPFIWQLWRAAGRSDLFHVMANSGWSWHLFAVPAIWVAWLRGVPVVVNYRGGEAGVFLQRSRVAVQTSMRRASRLIVPSGFLEQVFARHCMPAQVVPNIVDLRRFHPADAPVRDRLHLVVARNLEALYDNETALRVLEIVRRSRPEATLTIAGTGPQAEFLEYLALELGLADAVRFAGRLDPDAMAELYRSADVALNPSLADNMPNSVLEALASGVTVVSTNVGGLPFMVRHEVHALLVPPRCPRDMAAAVLRVVQDTALQQRLVSAGLAEVQRYRWDAVAPLLASVYRSVISAQASLSPRRRHG